MGVEWEEAIFIGGNSDTDEIARCGALEGRSRRLPDQMISCLDVRRVRNVTWPRPLPKENSRTRNKRHVNGRVVS